MLATALSASTDRFPTPQALVIIFLVAIAVRLLSVAGMGYKFDRWADLPYQSDGSAYLGNSARINGERKPNEYDQRMFVGLPWVIAMVSRSGLEPGWTAQGLCLLFAGGMCAAWAAFFRDTRIGWALAILPPHWVNDTSAVMNESLMLLLACAGMAAARSRAGWWMIGVAGLAFGAAGMVRPMVCFATAGAMAMLWFDGRRSRALWIGIASGASVAVLYATFYAAYWNPMENVRVYQDHPTAYGGEMLTWPFKSMIAEFRARGLLHPAVLYKTGYIVAALVIAGYSVHRLIKTRSPLDAMACVWWTSNTLFVLCIGSHWGMRIAQRSTAWAIPAAVFLLVWMLPVKWYWRLAWAALPVPLLFAASQG